MGLHHLRWHEGYQRLKTLGQNSASDHRRSPVQRHPRYHVDPIGPKEVAGRRPRRHQPLRDADDAARRLSPPQSSWCSDFGNPAFREPPMMEGDRLPKPEAPARRHGGCAMRGGRWAALLAALLSLAVANATDVDAKSLSFVLDTTANRATEAQAIVAQFGQAGINAEVRVWQPSVLLAQIQAGQRVAYTTDWGSAYFDPFDLAVPKYMTRARGNFSFYSNPAVDRDMVTASTTTND